jgi:Na+/proline symporter
LVGLLIAVILCAAMSATASELTALGSTSTVDLYKRLAAGQASPRRDLLVSKLFTVLWGLVAVAFACFAGLLDNLIQAVNILGSIFYGTVLGLFMVAFFLPRCAGGGARGAGGDHRHVLCDEHRLPVVQRARLRHRRRRCVGAADHRPALLT